MTPRKQVPFEYLNELKRQSGNGNVGPLEFLVFKQELLGTIMAAISNEILIVGGGPSGLLLAHELLRRRIPVRIIEKRPGPSHTSRAMTIHARSMEMFDHMGLANRLEEVCLECPGNIYHFPQLPEDKCPRTDYR